MRTCRSEDGLVFAFSFLFFIRVSIAVVDRIRFWIWGIGCVIYKREGYI